MRVILRLAEHQDRKTGRPVDSPFDPVVFDGNLDLDAVHAARREGQPLQIGEHGYLVKNIRIDSVMGETVAEVEVITNLR